MCPFVYSFSYLCLDKCRSPWNLHHWFVEYNPIIILLCQTHSSPHQFHICDYDTIIIYILSLTEACVCWKNIKNHNHINIDHDDHNNNCWVQYYGGKIRHWLFSSNCNFHTEHYVGTSYYYCALGICILYMYIIFK